MKQLVLMAVLLAVLSCVSCMPPKPPPRFTLLKDREARELLAGLNLSDQGLGSWEDMSGPLSRSLHYVERKKGTALNVPGELLVSWEQVRNTLKRMQELLPFLDKHPELLLSEFDFYLLSDEQLFTGYFEPQLEASLEKRPGYPYPLYGLPDDLKVADLGAFHPRWQGQRLVYRIDGDHIEPYYDRQSIDGQGVLAGKAPVLAWARDLLDVFFLQIQGSGQLLLPDGGVRYIGYAGKNGRQYVSLGRYLVEQGYMQYSDLSLQSIVDFLHKHQDLLPEVLFVNPSYVFFKFNESGPLGAIGEVLTPLVSLAVDPASIPLGSLMFFQVNLPDYSAENMGQQATGPAPQCRPASVPVRLGLAQDVGGAITGNHLDLFCGTGTAAGHLAGHLKSKGLVCLLLLKQGH